MCDGEAVLISSTIESRALGTSGARTRVWLAVGDAACAFFAVVGVVGSLFFCALAVSWAWGMLVQVWVALRRRRLSPPSIFLLFAPLFFLAMAHIFAHANM